MEDLLLAADEFFIQNENIAHPLNPEGITGTSIGFGEHGIGIVVHIKSSQEVYNLIPESFKSLILYKRFESNENEIK